MNITEFGKNYGTEKQCKELFVTWRKNQGVICKKCNCNNHYWLQTIFQFQCKDCGFRTTLRSGTVLESSKLPYRYWMHAMYLMTMTKKGISAKEMQKQLGHKRYEPVFHMMHKIRSIMSKDALPHKLTGVISLLEKNIQSVVITKAKSSTIAQVNPNSTLIITGKSRENLTSNNLSMNHWDSILMLQSKDSLYFINDGFQHGRRQYTPKLIMDSMEVIKQISNDKSVTLKLMYDKHATKYKKNWLKIFSGNMQRIIYGIHHHVKADYLQNYLSEFSYKSNKRTHNNLFSELSKLSVSSTWYNALYKQADNQKISYHLDLSPHLPNSTQPFLPYS